MRTGLIKQVLPITAVVFLMALAGCSSKQSINFKIHTEPEGAHVIIRQDKSRWTYLGVTPLDVVEIFPGDLLEKNNTISLKAMRCGYFEQVKEWTGEQLEQENEEKGRIFWTPRLIKDTQ
jgi:hypothetical protein